MAEEVDRVLPEGPSVDFSFQLNLARDRIEKKIFSYLCQLSESLNTKKERLGILIVFGMFGTHRSSVASGMRSLSNDRVDTYMNIGFPQFKDDIFKLFEQGEDGAIIINQDGQILAEKIYLTVDVPSVDIPEGTGTRHISAASFSMRPDVLATFTLSEETLMVRTWKDGTYIEQFYPGQKEDKEV